MAALLKALATIQLTNREIPVAQSCHVSVVALQHPNISLTTTDDTHDWWNSPAKVPACYVAQLEARHLRWHKSKHRIQLLRRPGCASRHTHTKHPQKIPPYRTVHHKDETPTGHGKVSTGATSACATQVVLNSLTRQTCTLQCIPCSLHTQSLDDKGTRTPTRAKAVHKFVKSTLQSAAHGTGQNCTGQN